MKYTSMSARGLPLTRTVPVTSATRGPQPSPPISPTKSHRHQERLQNTGRPPLASERRRIEHLAAVARAQTLIRGQVDRAGQEMDGAIDEGKVGPTRVP